MRHQNFTRVKFCTLAAFCPMLKNFFGIYTVPEVFAGSFNFFKFVFNLIKQKNKKDKKLIAKFFQIIE